MAGHTPNFFIVGAAKSGTSSVARYLAEHPQVFMSPIKEPSYFARDIITDLQPPNWRGGCVLEWEAYLKLAPDGPQAKAAEKKIGIAKQKAGGGAGKGGSGPAGGKK